MDLDRDSACIVQESISDKFTLGYLKQQVNRCSFSKELAYTRTFVNLTKLLQHSLAVLRGIVQANGSRKSALMYAIFSDSADPTKFVYIIEKEPKDISDDMQVFTVQFNSKTHIKDIQSVETVVSRCFEILNGMMVDADIRPHLFPIRKRVSPKTEPTSKFKSSVTAVNTMNNLLKKTLITQIKDLAVKISNFLDEKDPYGGDANYKERYTTDYPRAARNTTAILVEADKASASDPKEELYALLQKLREDFAQMKEKLVGEVQVYLRLKSGGSGEGVFKFTDGNPSEEIAPRIELSCPPRQPVALDSTTAIMTKSITKTLDDIGKGKAYEPISYDQRDYAKIFRSSDTNKDVLNSLQDTLNNTLYGRNVMIFGYGYSGSGKTYTLLNQDKHDDNNGIILQWTQTSNAKISIHSVFEIYSAFSIKDTVRSDGNKTYPAIKRVELSNFQLNTENPQVGYELTCVHIYGEELYKSKSVREDLKWKSFIDTKTLNKASTLSISTFFRFLDEYRTQQLRIRETLNNKQSSRSHLFIVLKVEHEGNTGYLTIIDMAGREDPIDLVKSEFMISRLETSLLYSTLGKNANVNVGNIKQIWFQSPENRSYFIKWLTDQSEAVIKKFLTQFPRLYEWLLTLVTVTKVDKSTLLQVVQMHAKEFNERLGHLSSYELHKFVTDNPNLTEFVQYVKNEDLRRSMLLKEGIIINETINHISSYFRRKKYKYEIQENRPPVTSMLMNKKDLYKPEFVLSDPEVALYRGRTTSEIVRKGEGNPYAIFTASTSYIWNDNMKVYDSSPLSDSINISDPNLKANLLNARKSYVDGLKKSLIIPVIKTIEQLGSGKNNYIMLCCARTEKAYCEDVSKTLDFARDISSRNIKDDIKQIKLRVGGGVRKYRKQNKKVSNVQKKPRSSS